MLSGKYVQTFAEASHALPDGMHMNSDYPFMLPRIVKLEGGTVTIKGSRGDTTSFPIKRRRGQHIKEAGEIHQSSSFEKLFGRKPQRFLMLPFKDEATPAIGDGQGNLFGEEGKSQ